MHRRLPTVCSFSEQRICGPSDSTYLPPMDWPRGIILCFVISTAGIAVITYILLFQRSLGNTTRVSSVRHVRARNASKKHFYKNPASSRNARDTLISKQGTGNCNKTRLTMQEQVYKYLYGRLCPLRACSRTAARTPSKTLALMCGRFNPISAFIKASTVASESLCWYKGIKYYLHSSISIFLRYPDTSY